MLSFICFQQFPRWKFRSYVSGKKHVLIFKKWLYGWINILAGKVEAFESIHGVKISRVIGQREILQSCKTYLGWFWLCPFFPLPLTLQLNKWIDTKNTAFNRLLHSFNFCWTINVTKRVLLALSCYSITFLNIVKSGLVYEQPPAMPRSPQIKMARWPKADEWDGKVYKGKYSLVNDIKRCRTCSGVPRGCASRIRLMTTQASWLAQVGGGVLIGQRACWLMT